MKNHIKIYNNILNCQLELNISNLPNLNQIQ